MEKSVRILSTQSNAHLVFSGIAGDEFDVTFRAGDSRVGVRVWADAGRSDLAAFFRSMARDWRGWDDARVWRSRDGDLKFSCTSDRLGHVTVEVSLAGLEKPETWRFVGTLVVDPGQLDRIANEVQSFFEP